MTSIAEPSPSAACLAACGDARPERSPPSSGRRADRVRLSRLVRAHVDAVWRLLRRLGVREGDVDDGVQRVFLTASRKLRLIEAGKERAFLMAVATREASHVRRSYRRRAEVCPEAMEDKSTGRPRPDEVANNRQALEYVSAAIDELPEDLRVVFVLFEVEQMSSDEIAESLGIPTGTVKSRLRRARERFSARTAHLDPHAPDSARAPTASGEGRAS